MTDRALFVAFCTGIVLLAVGAGWFSLGAGLLVAGVALVVCPILYARGAARERFIDGEGV